MTFLPLLLTSRPKIAFDGTVRRFSDATDVIEYMTLLTVKLTSKRNTSGRNFIMTKFQNRCKESQITAVCCENLMRIESNLVLLITLYKLMASSIGLYGEVSPEKGYFFSGWRYVKGQRVHKEAKKNQSFRTFPNAQKTHSTSVSNSISTWAPGLIIVKTLTEPKQRFTVSYLGRKFQFSWLKRQMSSPKSLERRHWYFDCKLVP